MGRIVISGVPYHGADEAIIRRYSQNEVASSSANETSPRCDRQKLTKKMPINRENLLNTTSDSGDGTFICADCQNVTKRMFKMEYTLDSSSSESIAHTSSNQSSDSVSSSEPEHIEPDTNDQREWKTTCENCYQLNETVRCCKKLKILPKK